MLEEEDDDDLLLIELSSNNDNISPIFNNRYTEGTYSTLIMRHLIDNETKFKEYFPLTPSLFNDVVNCIKHDIKYKPCNRHLNPLSVNEKLSITLR